MKRPIFCCYLFLSLFCLSCLADQKTDSQLSDFIADSSEIAFNQIWVEEDLQAYTLFPAEGLAPAILILEGSYTQNTIPQSVLRLLKPFERILTEARHGLIFMEKRGVTPEHFDQEKFHQFNTPSQRLADHFKLLEFLKKNPPDGWNGDLVILGGSEGGPIAIKLSKEVDPMACITLVGCGDQTFKELIWHTLQDSKNASSIKNTLFAWWHDLPQTYLDFNEKCEFMKQNPSPKKWWFGQTYLYWSDALDQEEKTAFLQLHCPALVITGSKDLEEPSTQRLVSEAEERGQDVIYKCVEGMGHDILEPQWKVMDTIIDFLHSLKT